MANACTVGPPDYFTAVDDACTVGPPDCFTADIGLIHFSENMLHVLNHQAGSMVVKAIRPNSGRFGMTTLATSMPRAKTATSGL